ncbi:MFS transporter [Streptomyces sp. NPDC002896]|uniref:MFS transporter n=1 Tax=Streptomyces sp. NPDC002896 TaxID=3154438 RepID=UPI0033220917
MGRARNHPIAGAYTTDSKHRIGPRQDSLYIPRNTLRWTLPLCALRAHPGNVSRMFPSRERSAMSNGKPASQEYSRRQLAVILISAMLGYATDGYNMLILPFILPSLKQDLGLTAGEASLILSSQLFASVVGGLLFGWLSDRIGRKSGLFWSIALFSVGALLSGTAWDFWSLLLFRFITGIGLGGEWGVGMALFNEAWKKRRGLGSAVIQSCLPLGSVGAGLVAAAIIGAQGPSGWRWVLISGALPVVLCVFIRIWMPESLLWKEYDRKRRERLLPPQEEGSTFRALMAKPVRRTWILGFLLVGGYMVAYYGVTSFMPSLIADTYDQPPSIWQQVNTFAVWVVIPIKIACGLWGDRIGRRTASVTPILVLLLASLGLLWLSGNDAAPFPGSIWTWVIFWLFFMWSCGTSCASLFGAWLSESFPTRVRATGVSTTYMFGRGLSALSPVAVPLVASGDLQRGMGVVSTVGALMFLGAALLLPETKGRRLDSGGQQQAAQPSQPPVMR